MPADVVEVPVSPPYPVAVGAGLELAGVVSEAVAPGVCAILTDRRVGPLHAGHLRAALEDAGWRVSCVLEVPAGESSKSLETYAGVVRELAREGVTRDGVLFALGGGVVGDLGGFVAATFLRGIRLVMLPTSLLAMVDSSVGGKTGLDLPEGKNLVGAFVRPRLVAADLDWLRTLPADEVSNGLAEVVKMGLLAGDGFLEDLDLIDAARAGEAEALRALILRSVRFKAAVVGGDEKEGGRRAVLNYGHTVGHALEAAADYALPHGAAVAAGMVAAASLSKDRYGSDLTGLHGGLISAAGLPRRVPDVDAESVLQAMSRDKKRSADGGHRFVLLPEVGKPVHGVPVSDGEARRAINAVVG